MVFCNLHCIHRYDACRTTCGMCEQLHCIIAEREKRFWKRYYIETSSFTQITNMLQKRYTWMFQPIWSLKHWKHKLTRQVTGVQNKKNVQWLRRLTCTVNLPQPFWHNSLHQSLHFTMHDSVSCVVGDMGQFRELFLDSSRWWPIIRII